MIRIVLYDQSRVESVPRKKSRGHLPRVTTLSRPSPEVAGSSVSAVVVKNNLRIRLIE